MIPLLSDEPTTVATISRLRRTNNNNNASKDDEKTQI
jgi:hypothetical protein